jgi:hypothetical protein
MWCNMIELPHHEANQSAEELTDLDQREEHDDAQPYVSG